MGSAWDQRTRSLIDWSLRSYFFFGRKSVGKNLPPHFLQSPVVMVADVTGGLAKFYGDLIKCVTLSEKQSQCFPLLVREQFQYFLKSFSAANLVDRTLNLPTRCEGVAVRLSRFVQIQSGVEWREVR